MTTLHLLISGAFPILCYCVRNRPGQRQSKACQTATLGYYKADQIRRGVMCTRWTYERRNYFSHL